MQAKDHPWLVLAVLISVQRPCRRSPRRHYRHDGSTWLICESRRWHLLHCHMPCESKASLSSQRKGRQVFVREMFELQAPPPQLVMAHRFQSLGKGSSETEPRPQGSSMKHPGHPLMESLT